jgi:hypothetical protein
MGSSSAIAVSEAALVTMHANNVVSLRVTDHLRIANVIALQNVSTAAKMRGVLLRLHAFTRPAFRSIGPESVVETELQQMPIALCFDAISG